MAQWLNYRNPGTPRNADGKANLSAPTPKTSDGKPDLSGVWHAQITPVEEWRWRFGDSALDAQLETAAPGMGIGTISIYARNVFLDLKSADNPMRPGTRLAPPHPATIPCYLMGFPRNILLSAVHKIVQTPNLILMMIESGNVTRQIYTDGRPLPQDPQPSWLGYSVGKWEGDTLVVDSIGFNDLAPLDGSRHPRSESLHMTERYRRHDFGHMDVEITFDDPRLYTDPFSKFTDELQPDTDILENICIENEKDTRHMISGPDLPQNSR